MINRTPARDRPGAHGVAERLVVPLKPGNAGGGKGPQFKTDARRSEGPGDWATYQLRTAFRNCRRRCTRKRRQNPTFASTPCTTRSAARTFWRMPMPSAAPTRARRAWTVRTSRRSRRTGLSDGWANWRLRSGRRLTDQTLSDGFSYRRPAPIVGAPGRCPSSSSPRGEAQLSQSLLEVGSASQTSIVRNTEANHRRFENPPPSQNQRELVLHLTCQEALVTSPTSSNWKARPTMEAS